MSECTHNWKDKPPPHVIVTARACTECNCEQVIYAHTGLPPPPNDLDEALNVLRALMDARDDGEEYLAWQNAIDFLEAHKCCESS